MWFAGSAELHGAISPDRPEVEVLTISFTRLFVLLVLAALSAGLLSISEDASEMAGTDQWEFTEPGFSCAGETEITVTRDIT